ncbi:MAG: hypothetical protein K6F16_03935 [Lachnospiraceae bacterium]|nr:hypothetical protein [Lachnospiraceae bacterium]
MISLVHPYITMDDETEVVFSDISLKDGRESLTVFFERPVLEGFVSAECSLPSYKWTVKGLTAKEIARLQEFVERNERSFFKFARQGGVGGDA